MIITCGQCQAKFKVAPEQIKETGSKVRCSNCQYVFTVYRPQRPAAASGRAKSGSGRAGKLDDFLKGLEGRQDGFDDGLSDLFKDRPADSPAWTAPEAGGGPDDNDGEDHPGGETMKERRDRRRRLYADLDEGLAREADEEDSPDDMADDDGPDGQPHLRRGRAAKAAEKGAGDLHEDFEDLPEGGEDEEDEPDEDAESEEEGGEYEDEDDEGEEEGDGEEEEDDDGEYEDDEEDEEYEEYEDDGSETRPDGGDLGLSADPMGSDRDQELSRPKGVAIGSDAREPAVVRPAITRTKKSSPRLLLVLAIVAAVLAICIYFLASRPEPTALSTGEEAAPAETAEGRNPEDSTGTESITFTKNQQSHYFRDNAQAGKILIITGMVHNSYATPRSFIRLRGLLLNAANETLADRFAYAGNIISEEELTTLPMSEILARLSVKGGQNGLNMNIEPNQGIPFMLVFDKLPEGMEQYRIDPVGSAPAD